LTRQTHSGGRFPGALAAIGAALLLQGCGGAGSSPMYTVSVTLSGLQSSKSVILQDNGSDNLPVSANGTIAFSTALSSGAAYSVTVLTQPVGQTCTVVSGNGTVGNNDILLAVSCSVNSYTVGGTVTGLLSGASLTLKDGQGATVTINANGAYSFSSPISSASSYSVTVVTQPVGEVCTVANASGTIGGSNVTNANVNCSRAPYTVNAEVVGLRDVSGLVLQDNAGDNLATSTSGTFPFTTQVTSGQTYSVTILRQPTGHTCSVLSGSGTIGTTAVTVAVSCPWHVGYVPSSQGILAYFVDQATGATVPLPGNPFPAGVAPSAIVVSPIAGFLYATNQGSNTVSAYSINPVDGSLAAVAGSPFAVGATPTVLATDSQGKFLYVGNSSAGTISAFTINPATGALAAVAGSPFATEGNLKYLGVSAAWFLYSGYQVISSQTPPYYYYAYVSVFAIDPLTGALSEIAASPFQFAELGNQPGNPYYIAQFAIDPMGRFLYAVGDTLPPGGFIAAATINSTTGALSYAANYFWSGGAGNLSSVVIDRTGSFLYTAENLNGGYGLEVLNEYAIKVGNSNLTLSPVGNVGYGSPPPNPVVLSAVDPSNTFVFAGCSSCSIGPYAIDHSTGALTPFQKGPAINAFAAPVAFSQVP